MSTGVTSFNELGREGESTVRWNGCIRKKKPRKIFVEKCLQTSKGPVIASTDYMKSYAEQIRSYVGRGYTVLGTDGFGRSDTREKLRQFFEVDDTI